MLKKPLFTIVFFAWMAFITFASLYPFQGDETPGFDIPDPDKLVHFTFYFVASILGILFLRERTTGTIKLSKALILMLVALIAFGLLMEFMQHAFTENRKAELFDAVANIIGCLCGIWVIKTYFSGKRQLKWKY